MQNRVYISYALKDLKVVSQIKNLLESNGVSVWIANERINDGDYFKESIRNGLNSSAVVLMIATKEFLQSRAATFEMGAAFALNKKVIPIILDEPEAIPTELASLHFYRLTDENRNELVQLVKERIQEV